MRIIKNRHKKIPKSLITGARGTMTRQQIYDEYVFPYKFMAEHRSPKIKILNSKHRPFQL